MADELVRDRDAAWQVGESGYESRSENCCFDGQTFKGRILLTVAAGIVAFRAVSAAERAVLQAVR